MSVRRLFVIFTLFLVILLLIDLTTTDRVIAPRAAVREVQSGDTEKQAQAKPRPAPLRHQTPLALPGDDLFTLDELLKYEQRDASSSDSGDTGGETREMASSTVVGGARRSASTGIDSSGSGQVDSGLAVNSPELDALREIEELNAVGNGTSLIGGARVSTTPPPEPIRALPTPTVTPVPDEILPRVGGQARGYTMLYLMHPNARATVDKQVETMLRSQVDDLYLAVLTDGTFSLDYTYLSNVIRRLSRANRSVTLVVYLTNGATMRAHETTEITAGFNQIDPTLFRSLIRTDAAIRDRFVRLTRPVVPVLQLNRRLSPRSRNFIVVMLEDNLDDESYLAMRRLAEGVIGDRATFIRNPCPGCWEGNTTNSFGDGLELHRPEEIATLGLRDGFSFDGVGYRLPNEPPDGQLSYEESQQRLIEAATRGLRYAGLWRYDRQGLRLGIEPRHPDERTYAVPTNAAAEAEIDLLRAGLVEIEQIAE